MARRGGHHIGEQVSIKQRNFEISGLEVTDKSKIEKAMAGIFGYIPREIVTKPEAKCYLDKEINDILTNYDHRIGAFAGPSVGKCGKCGLSVWVLFKRIS
jgi:hypothetical protein